MPLLNSCPSYSVAILHFWVDLLLFTMTFLYNLRRKKKNIYPWHLKTSLCSIYKKNGQTLTCLMLNFVVNGGNFFDLTFLWIWSLNKPVLFVRKSALVYWIYRSCLVIFLWDCRPIKNLILSIEQWTRILLFFILIFFLFSLPLL